MASWSSVVTIQLSHQECEHNDFATHGIAPPLGFAKSLNEVPEDGLEHHQVVFKRSTIGTALEKDMGNGQVEQGNQGCE